VTVVLKFPRSEDDDGETLAAILEKRASAPHTIHVNAQRLTYHELKQIIRLEHYVRDPPAAGRELGAYDIYKVNDTFIAIINPSNVSQPSTVPLNELDIHMLTYTQVGKLIHKT